MKKFARASHDLQEPLRAIKIYSELLTRRHRDKLDGEALEFLGFLRNGATRMETLVRDLLAFTRISKLDVVPDQVDANTALSKALESLTIFGAGSLCTIRSLAAAPRSRPRNCL
jgi:light-regulated signal transduction histidine kinase (bacteriophytochrome)